MKSRRLYLIIFVVVAAGFWIYGRQRIQMDRQLAENLPRLGNVAQMRLTNQLGEAVTGQSLVGQVWIANFIFTRCMGPCPVMTKKMAQLQADLGADTAVKLVSFSVDPEYDTPRVLAEYGKKHGADPGQWQFLTGDKEHIIDIATTMFKLPAGEEPDMHSTKFTLIDQLGTIRGYFDAAQSDQLQQLLQQARALARLPNA